MALLHVKQFAAQNITSTTPVTLFTVPAGERWVIHRVIAQNHSGASKQLVLGLGPPGTMKIFTLAAELAAGDSADWDTWVVLEPGQTFVASLQTAGNVGCIVSGYHYTI